MGFIVKTQVEDINGWVGMFFETGIPSAGSMFTLFCLGDWLNLKWGLLKMDKFSRGISTNSNSVNGDGNK